MGSSAAISHFYLLTSYLWTRAIHFDLAEEPKGLCVPEAVNEPSARPTHLALIHSMPDISFVLDSIRLL